MLTPTVENQIEKNMANDMKIGLRNINRVFEP